MGATTADLDDLLLHDELLKAVGGRALLLFGLTLSAVIGFIGHIMVLAIVGWLGSWFIGTHIISQAAPLLRTSSLVKYPLFLSCAMPFLSLAAPLYLWTASRSARTELEVDIRQAQLRERRAGPAAPAPAEDAAPVKAPIEEALPVLRDVVGSGLTEGQDLKMQIARPDGRTDLPPGTELPPTRATQSVFAVGYHVDHGPIWSSVNHSDLRAAKMDLNGLHRRALGNLMQLVKGQPGLKLLGGEPYYGLRLDGDHEASLVLLEGLWDQLFKDKTPNGAVVAIPTRDALAFCDADSADGVAALREVVKRLGPDAKGAVFQGLLLRRDGLWSVLEDYYR